MQQNITSAIRQKKLQQNITSAIRQKNTHTQKQNITAAIRQLKHYSTKTLQQNITAAIRLKNITTEHYFGRVFSSLTSLHVQSRDNEHVRFRAGVR